MNKRVLLGMTLMASLAFYSCTKEVVIVQEGGEGGIETPTAQDGQVLTLQVANSGDGLTTRAGRPLLSSQAKQDINTIVLYVVDGSNKVVLKKTIGPDEWANALDYSNTSAHGKQLQITFRKSDNQALIGTLEGTAYTIYAVGYKSGSNYKVDANFGVSGTPSTTTSDGSGATLTATNFATTLAANTAAADEIFAGKVAVKVVTKADGTSYIVAGNAVDVNNKVVPALVLNRQVAGVTGYFTNLPAKVDKQIPTKIRLVASNKSNKVHFTSMLPGETGTDSSVKNVVNGSWSGSEAVAAEKGNYWDNSKKGYIVYEIALSEFFPQLSSQTFESLDLDNDNCVGYKDAQYYVYKMGERSNEDGEPINFTDLAQADTDGKTFLEKTWSDAIQGKQVTVNGKTITANQLSTFWKNPNDKTQTLVAGSVFAGEFIIPFLQVTSPSNVNTFELQLLDKDDNILKNWNVQVDKKVGNSDGSLAEGITGGSWSPDASTFVYNVYRNHLYSLGLKTTNIEGGEDPDPEKPEKPVDPKPNPDPDGGGENPEDQPEDLSKGQDLLLNVNDNWEIIHNMVID
ncbi:hypothetical protein [Phocaeicola plebeius]|uniref:hypothetical protein n=1 Tax=Phocaeicola plebeius TaxID=310297 RepID=UPI0026F14C06|nr:hypothetical protein [Phocaeicola plebeius]